MQIISVLKLKINNQQSVKLYWSIAQSKKAMRWNSLRANDSYRQYTISSWKTIVLLVVPLIFVVIVLKTSVEVDEQVFLQWAMTSSKQTFWAWHEYVGWNNSSTIRSGGEREKSLLTELTKIMSMWNHHSSSYRWDRDQGSIWPRFSFSALCSEKQFTTSRIFIAHLNHLM